MGRIRTEGVLRKAAEENYYKNQGNRSFPKVDSRPPVSNNIKSREKTLNLNIFNSTNIDGVPYIR